MENMVMTHKAAEMQTTEETNGVDDDFAAEFRRSIRRAIQNTEREQVLDLVTKATRIRIDFEMTRRVFNTISDCPNMIERNLDMITLPHAPATFIEIDDHARRETDLPSGIARIGFLIAPHPADPGVLIVAIARQIPERVEGACHLMPAFCAINLASLTDLSMRARRYLSTTPQDSIARMVMHLRTYVPPGFTPELDEFTKVVDNIDSDTLHLASRMETAREGVFLLALLVALAAENVVVSESGDGIRIAKVAPRQYGRGRRTLATLRLKAAGPVDRSYRKGHPVLSLVDA